ncbi:TIGR04282 family arsenosugar biosynthesis glycosyltransferase [Myxococcota bacterium]|nr:TIGR04282 family arsenosugar biosynthesis glycosyltransferase [Myxococcota bacterium]
MPAASNWADGPRDVVAVLAKSPHPGRVKTRMCPPLDPHQAADLYEAMLADVLAATERFARESGLDPVLCVDPPEAVSDLVRLAPPSFRVVAQHGAGLAERMAWALDEARATGAAKVLLRGSDNPALSRAILDSALEALEEADLVVSPDLDGGYGLIGMRGPWSAVFDHPMSRPSVLDDTLTHAARLGLRVQQLEGSFDLDRGSDLDRLIEASERDELDFCERTVQWIQTYRMGP